MWVKAANLLAFGAFLNSHLKDLLLPLYPIPYFLLIFYPLFSLFSFVSLLFIPLISLYFSYSNYHSGDGNTLVAGCHDCKIYIYDISVTTDQMEGRVQQVMGYEEWTLGVAIS